MRGQVIHMYGILRFIQHYISERYACSLHGNLVNLCASQCKLRRSHRNARPSALLYSLYSLYWEVRSEDVLLATWVPGLHQGQRSDIQMSTTGRYHSCSSSSLGSGAKYRATMSSLTSWRVAGCQTGDMSLSTSTEGRITGSSQEVIQNCPHKKDMFLYSAVSGPSDRSKRCTLFTLPGRPVHSDINSASPGSILAMQQLCATTKSPAWPPLSIPRYSFIQLSQPSMERTKMPNLRNASKGGIEHGLTWLRVRHSTAELPHSITLSNA